MTLDTSRAAPTALRRTDVAVSSYGDAGSTWLAAMWQADPLADAVVNDPAGRGAARSVRTLMTEGIAAVSDPEPSVSALLERLTAEPDWLDHDRLDRASDVLVRYSAQWGLVLGAASLLAGADNWIAAKPLLLTGRYGSEPAVRSIEVGEWLSRVVAPGGMAIDAPGFQHTVRVRMIHAHVRRHIRDHAEWDEEAWGVPIPQPYMAFTLAEFGHISLAAMAELGVRLRDAELADIYHLWRYVGHVIGVDPVLNPVDEADHVRIEELYHLTSPGPDEYSQAFCRALTEDYLAPQLATMLPGPERFRQDVARHTMYGMSRVFLGDPAADALGVPDGAAKHVVRAARPVLLALDQARLRVLGRERVTARGYAARDVELARLRAENGMTHDLVDAVPGAVGAGGSPSDGSGPTSRAGGTDAPGVARPPEGRSRWTYRWREEPDMDTTDAFPWTSGRLIELPSDECGRLLASHAVGRVAWNGPSSPTVVPVNFVVVDDEIWFRTAARSSIAREIDDLAVSFQVDDVDDFTRSGWSVLVRGTAHVVYDAARLPRSSPDLETWPSGPHALYVVIKPHALTGRRLLPS